MRITQSAVGFPFLPVIRNALRLKPSRRAVFWAAEAFFSAGFSTGAVYHTPCGSRPSGVPLLLAPPCRRSGFASGVLKPNGMERDGAVGFVVEHPDAIVALVQTKNLPSGTNGELKKLPMGDLLPAAELPSGFCWEILSADFEALCESDLMPPSVVVVGLPQKVCWWAENWAEAHEGRLLGVWPAMLAILHWCRVHAAGFFFIPGEAQSFLAVFDSGRLQLLMKLPPARKLAFEVVEEWVARIRAELQLDSAELYIHPFAPPRLEGGPSAALHGDSLRMPGTSFESPGKAREARTAVLENLLSIKGL